MCCAFVSSYFACCVTREGDACCAWQDGHGIGPTDACLREALPEVFYDCAEGDRTHDLLFEQARLKMIKGKMLANFAYDVLSHSPCLAKLPDDKKSENLLTCGAPAGLWMGTTFEKKTSKEPAGINDPKPRWLPGRGADLRVRRKEFKKTHQKQDATESLAFGGMYECVSCDAIKADTKIQDIIGRLVSLDSVPRLDVGVSESERGAGAELAWTRECPLPRVICINLELPYTTGSGDPGCSFVAFFHIKPEVLQEIRSGKPSPCIRMFEEFCRGPAGKPGVQDDPNRSLNLRRNSKLKADGDTGLFKATAWCENVSDLNMPSWMTKFNGKPVTITKSGYIVKENAGFSDLPGEWMEIGVDMRHFNWLARQALVSNRARLRHAAIHFGFMVQAVEDEDLPEGLICDMHVSGVDIEADPMYIEN